MDPEQDRTYAASIAKAIIGLEIQRNALSNIRTELDDIGREFQPKPMLPRDRITESTAGGLTCIISSMHNDIERLRDSFGVARARIDGRRPLRYNPRGPGLNWLPCCVCGDDNAGHAQPDMAAYVRGKDGGEAVVSLFEEMGLSAKLDYRDFEPTYVQVKIGACEKHKAFLDVLCEETRFGSIDPEAIRIALKAAE